MIIKVLERLFSFISLSMDLHQHQICSEAAQQVAVRPVRSKLYQETGLEGGRGDVLPTHDNRSADDRSESAYGRRLTRASSRRCSAALRNAAEPERWTKE